MQDARYYIEKARKLGAKAHVAATPDEREGYNGLAAGYLHLAKELAKREVGAPSVEGRHGV